jgi:hypothetical protein
VTVCPKGTAPSDLPRIGDKRSNARRFQPRQSPGAAQRPGTRPEHRWSNARLERELRAFLKDHPHWPRPDTFMRAGRGELLQQAHLHGSDEWWAFRLKLPMQRPPGPRRPWTDHRIHTELADYLHNKPTWPTQPQFRADGLLPLRRAITQSGGLKRWAPEFPATACPQLHTWTDTQIHQRLTALCARRSRFPSQRELSDAGLRYAVDHHHGRHYWAKQLRLPQPQANNGDHLQRTALRPNEPQPRRLTTIDGAHAADRDAERVRTQQP